MNNKKVKVGFCLFVEDIDSMVNYYQNILKFKVEKSGDFAEVISDSGYLSFFMYSKKSFFEESQRKDNVHLITNHTHEIGVWLPTFKDVDEEYDRLYSLGVKMPYGKPITHQFGIRNFYVEDIEGNLLEIGSYNE